MPCLILTGLSHIDEDGFTSFDRYARIGSGYPLNRPLGCVIVFVRSRCWRLRPRRIARTASVL
jgi:hypothetical protein